MIFLEIILFFLSQAKYEPKYEKGIKILTSKQMLQRLLIALAQVRVGNTSETLPNEIKQVIHSLFSVSSKKITKKLYNNIMNSIKL